MYFLMIPLTTFYDEHIEQPELTEQRTPIEHIVPPPPLSWVATIILINNIAFAGGSASFRKNEKPQLEYRIIFLKEKKCFKTEKESFKTEKKKKHVKITLEDA